MAHKRKKDMEIKFIYNSNQIKEREALGYAKSMGNHVVNEVDVYNQTFTERQLVDLAKKLDVELTGLLDEESEYYRENLIGKELDADGVLQIVKHQPDVFRTPIIDYGDSAIFVESPYDTVKMDMSFEQIKERMGNKDETEY